MKEYKKFLESKPYLHQWTNYFGLKYLTVNKDNPEHSYKDDPTKNLDIKDPNGDYVQLKRPYSNTATYGFIELAIIIWDKDVTDWETGNDPKQELEIYAWIKRGVSDEFEGIFNGFISGVHELETVFNLLGLP